MASASLFFLLGTIALFLHLVDRVVALVKLLK